MKRFTKQLLKEMNLKIEKVQKENTTLLKCSELSFFVCLDTISLLKDFILNYVFCSQDEEIDFFKRIKPAFTSLQYYYLMLYHIEARKPTGGKKVLRQYYNKQLENIKHYYCYNNEFYKYYRTDSTYLDHKYFSRNSIDINLSPESHVFENDPRFSTTHDFKVAKILAHDLLQIYLENELNNLENKDIHEQSIHFNKMLVWTDSKVFLVELIYALHTAGAFNRGALELKELAETLSQMFNIDINDIYRTWSEIKLRKEPTKYLDHLKNSLLEKIKEDLK